MSSETFLQKLARYDDNDGGKNRDGFTSVRGRVRSPHISGGRRWLRRDRRTDRAIPKFPLGRRHNNWNNWTERKLNRGD